METKANYVLVGVFTLLVCMLAFGFVYWIARYGESSNTVPLEVRIPGSVTGLSVGSQVLFNGIKVGDVRRLSIDASEPNIVVVETMVSRSTPITRSTKASLSFQGLTGQAYIELEGGNPGEPNLLAQAEKTGKTATISAESSAVNNILATAQKVLGSADRTLNAVEGFVHDVRGPLTETVNNAKVFSDALARNSGSIDHFLESIDQMSKTLTGVSKRLDTVLASAQDILKAVNTEKVQTIIDNVASVTGDLKKTSKQLDSIAQTVQGAANSFKDFSTGADQTIKKVDTLVSSVDPEQVKSAVGNIEQASQKANAAMTDFAKLSTDIGNRSQDIDQIITDTKQLAGRLNAASVRIDGVLQKVNSLLGQPGTQNLVTQARDTLEAYKKVADTINGKLDTIMNGLAKFSGPGLDNIQGFINDSRRSLDRIQQSISDLERNPQRVIFGGTDNVPRYNGRLRR